LGLAIINTEVPNPDGMLRSIEIVNSCSRVNCVFGTESISWSRCTRVHDPNGAQH